MKKENKNKRITFLLSDKEEQNLLQAANEEQRTKSDLARLYVIKALKARNSSKNEKI
jgi:hypothetical protein